MTLYVFLSTYQSSTTLSVFWSLYQSRYNLLAHKLLTLYTKNHMLFCVNPDTNLLLLYLLQMGEGGYGEYWTIGFIYPYFYHLNFLFCSKLPVVIAS